MRRRHSRDDVRVYADEEHLIVLLDRHGPRDSEGQRIQGSRLLGDKPLRFSITRGGNLKFSKPIKTEMRVKKVPVLDDEGNPVPNPRRAEEIERYGRSYLSEHLTEEVVLDEPHVRTSYEVDQDWWRRNANTFVKI